MYAVITMVFPGRDSPQITIHYSGSEAREPSLDASIPSVRQEMSSTVVISAAAGDRHYVIA